MTYIEDLVPIRVSASRFSFPQERLSHNSPYCSRFYTNDSRTENTLVMYLMERNSMHKGW